MNESATTGTVRMAKATQADLDAALELSGILESLGRGYYPSREDDNKPPTWFDSENVEHLQHLHERLTEIEEKGSLFRVVGGMETVLNPANELLDPDADCIAKHPAIVQALKDQARLAAAEKLLAAVAWDTHWRTDNNDLWPALVAFNRQSNITTQDCTELQTVAIERLIVELLDWQPLAVNNRGDRLWQILAAAGLPDGQQIEALRTVFIRSGDRHVTAQPREG